MEQVNVTLTETIKVLLDDKKFSTLRDILITMKPFDIAAVFENLQDEKMPILFRILPKELAAETFVEMDDETQEFLIHGFSDSELKEVVDELFVDDAEKNDDFAALLDSLVDKLIHRHDFQPVCTPSESGRLWGGIAQANDPAPECLFRLRVDHTGFDVETIFSRCSVDVIRG